MFVIVYMLLYVVLVIYLKKYMLVTTLQNSGNIVTLDAFFKMDALCIFLSG
jgi:hypothetical protein